MKRKRKLARRQSGDKTWSNKRTRKEDARKFLADSSDEENSIDSHDTTAETEEETVENIARLVQHVPKTKAKVETAPPKTKPKQNGASDTKIHDNFSDDDDGEDEERRSNILQRM